LFKKISAYLVGLIFFFPVFFLISSAIKPTRDIFAIPPKILFFSIDLGNFQTPYMGGDETTLATARDALTVNPSKDPADTEYDLRYHELIWNLYQKNSGNSYDDEVIANAHPYSFTINLQNIEDAFGIVDKSGRLTTVEFALITAASASVGGGLVEHSPVPIDNSDADFVTGSIINISGAYDIDMHLRFI